MTLNQKTKLKAILEGFSDPHRPKGWDWRFGKLSGNESTSVKLIYRNLNGEKAGRKWFHLNQGIKTRIFHSFSPSGISVYAHDWSKATWHQWHVSQKCLLVQWSNVPRTSGRSVVILAGRLWIAFLCSQATLISIWYHGKLKQGVVSEHQN